MDRDTFGTVQLDFSDAMWEEAVMGREKEAGLVTKAISTGNAKHRQWQLLGIEDGIQPAIVFPSGGAGVGSLVSILGPLLLLLDIDKLLLQL